MPGANGARNHRGRGGGGGRWARWGRHVPQIPGPCRASRPGASSWAGFPGPSVGVGWGHSTGWAAREKGGHGDSGTQVMLISSLCGDRSWSRGSFPTDKVWVPPELLTGPSPGQQPAKPNRTFVKFFAGSSPG